MSKTDRSFTFNYLPASTIAENNFGKRPQTALSMQGFEALDAIIDYLRAVEAGDANEIQLAIYAAGFAIETAQRLNERFHNVDRDQLYVDFGRAQKYDEGEDITAFFTWQEV